MNKLPSLAEVIAAVFLMSVCLYAGSEVGYAKATKQMETCK
jgi:hypothetical protein